MHGFQTGGPASGEPGTDPELAWLSRAVSRLGQGTEVEGECVRVQREFDAAWSAITSHGGRAPLEIYYAEEQSAAVATVVESAETSQQQVHSALLFGVAAGSSRLYFSVAARACSTATSERTI